MGLALLVMQVVKLVGTILFVLHVKMAIITELILMVLYVRLVRLDVPLALLLPIV